MATNPEEPPIELEEVYTAQRSRRFPEIDVLYKIELTPDKRSQKATCYGCNSARTNVKFDRLITHAQKCNKCDSSVVRALVQKVDEMKKKRVERSEKRVKVLFDMEKQTKIDSFLVRLIAESNLSISIVQSPLLKKFCKEFFEEYNPPSRKHFTYKLLPDASKRCFNQAIEKMKTANDYSLTTEFDGWKHTSGGAILAVVLTNQQGYSMLLDLIDITHIENTGPILADLVLTAMKCSGVPIEKFNSIISDEASNCRLARTIMVEKFSAHALIEYRCMAHVINLVGKDITKDPVILPVMKNLKKLISTISRSKTLGAKLKEAGARKLISTVPSRWYSIAGALNSVLKAKAAILAIPKTNQYGYSKWGHIVEDASFWKALQGFKVYFDRLAAMIGRSEERTALLSNSFRDFLDFGKFLVKSNLTLDYRDIALKAFVTHFNKLNLSLMFGAYLVNPNHKLEYLTKDSLEMGEEYLVKTLYDINYDDVNAANLLSAEFDRYKRNLDRTEKVSDVYGWWQKSRMPVLSIVAQRLSVLRASSANTERLFSTLNQIATPRRNRITCSTMFDLVGIQIHEANQVEKTARQQAAEPRLVASQLTFDHEGQNEVMEVEVEEQETQNTPGFDAEDELPGMYLFDPSLLDESEDELNIDELYFSSGYLQFTKLINYDITSSHADTSLRDLDSSESTSRLSSAEAARRFMASRRRS